ncbi:hypothetical protein JW978_00615 [Candidatus Dojkabacteria bacterium]|nr:hypothetical protein [Candidatus Dojkabacteria bacterium]
MADQKSFIKGVERLIKPIDVGTIHFVQGFNGLLPKSIQERLIKSTSKKYPQIGFVVEPYSYFLFHEIKDHEKAQKLLPDGFKPIRSKVFKDDKEPKYYAVFGCFWAHTSAFWGARVEFYIIAEDESTGLLTWVIVGYDSNTIGHDRKNGLSAPSCSEVVLTTDHEGILAAEFKRDDDTRQIAFESDVKNGEMKGLDQRLWLEGNLSICYGRELSENKPEVFSLKFDPAEVEEAIEIPLNNLKNYSNTWIPGLFEEKPAKLVCFPYAQHFLSDNLGYTSKLKNREELVNALNSTDFKNIKALSAASFKGLIMLGSVLSGGLITLLILYIVFG